MPNYGNTWGANWAPMNNAPATWQPNVQWPPPSNAFGYSQDRFRQQAQQPFNNIIRVSGPESAKAYYMPPGSQGVMFDADNPVFYWKTTDDSGFPTITRFRFFEDGEEAIEAPNVEVKTSKDDLDGRLEGLRSEVEGLKSDISEVRELLEGLVK